MTYYESPAITNYQRQIIIGTILGGSSVVKPKGGRNCYLLMRDRNRNWIAYKTLELKQLAPLQRPFNIEKHTVRWHSSCFPLFNEFRDLFYKKGKKKVTNKLMENLLLRDIGLAIWFGDAGRVQKGKAILNTHQFGKSGTQAVARYFRECGIDCEATTIRCGWRVVMSPEGTIRYLATIAHCLPEFMLNSIRDLPIVRKPQSSDPCQSNDTSPDDRQK
jgi:hypothetical protein